jgi:hypothetical protein
MPQQLWMIAYQRECSQLVSGRTRPSRTSCDSEVTLSLPRQSKRWSRCVYRQLTLLVADDRGRRERSSLGSTGSLGIGQRGADHGGQEHGSDEVLVADGESPRSQAAISSRVPQ